MKTKVFINGSEGTTGLRINERFANRNDIELIHIDSELRKDPSEIKKKINASDITFFCLPDAAAIEALTLVENPDVKIIDTSTAHRTLPDWAYGFPELSSKHRENINNGMRIAVPGCHASGFDALVYPLTSTGLLSKDSLLTCVSITGYSGGGKKTIANYQDTEARSQASLVVDPLISPRQYALTQNHKHLKEMKVINQLNNEPIFMPYISDFYAGMLVTVPIHACMLSKNMSLADIHEVFAKHYENSSLIKVQPLDSELIASGFIPANTVCGQDDMEIYIYGNDDRIMLSARFDNLGKGASGAAIQCMNVMLGLPDDYSLNNY